MLNGKPLPVSTGFFRSYTDLLSGLLCSFLFMLAPDGFFAGPPVFTSSLTVLALVGAACLVRVLLLEAVSEADAARDCDFLLCLTFDSRDFPLKPFGSVDEDDS